MIEKDLIKKIYKDKSFINIIQDIISNETVLEMKNYRQHCETSCFEHCLVASYYCYKICKKLKIDYISAARAAISSSSVGKNSWSGGSKKRMVTGRPSIAS